jgi:hypothetical protein
MGCQYVGVCLDGNKVKFCSLKIHLTKQLSFTENQCFTVATFGAFRVRVTLRLTVSQSVCLGIEPFLGLMTRYLFICLEVAVLSIWDALSDERSVSHSKSFVIIYIVQYLQVIKNVYVQYVQCLCQSRLGTADYALLFGAFVPLLFFYTTVRATWKLLVRQSQ